MKILFISESPINNQFSIGNTFLNLFSGIDDLELHSIYMRSGYADFKYISDSFQITYPSLLRGIISRKCTGKKITADVAIVPDDNIISDTVIEKSAKRFSSELIYIIRDSLWKLSPWKNSGIKEYLTQTNPDIIFTVFSSATPVNDMAIWAKKNTNAKLILYAWDDNYSYLRKKPLLLLRKAIIRQNMRKLLKASSKMYVISDIQKREYEKALNTSLEVITKGKHFDCFPEQKQSENYSTLSITYTGNLGVGRWKTLALLAQAIETVNCNNKTKFDLKIYTATPITPKIEKALSINGKSCIMGCIPSNEVKKIQKESDILVHVESFSKKHNRMVKQSFSTKIVDYLYSAKCILAIGPDYVASIDYLKKNNAAIVATNKNELYFKLYELAKNTMIINNYKHRAWNCGKKNHDIRTIQTKLLNDFNKILKG